MIYNYQKQRWCRNHVDDSGSLRKDSELRALLVRTFSHDEYEPLRTINDYYASVSLRRNYVGSEGERIEVVIRIPEEVANNLAGTERPPALTVSEVYRRVMNIAPQTADPAGHGEITVGAAVDSIIPPTLPAASSFQDQDGAEGWVLQ